MGFPRVTSRFGGSLIFATALTAAPDSPRLQLGSQPARAASIPTAILSGNVATASPAAAQFTGQNGYTGDLTLLSRSPG